MKTEIRRLLDIFIRMQEDSNWEDDPNNGEDGWYTASTSVKTDDPAFSSDQLPSSDASDQLPSSDADDGDEGP